MFQKSLLLLLSGILLEIPTFSAEPDPKSIDLSDQGLLREFDTETRETPRPARDLKRKRQPRNGAARNESARGGRLAENAERRKSRGAPRNQRTLVFSTESGFVFIDGAFLPPPYRIEGKDGVLYLNGVALSESSTDTESRESSAALKDDAEALCSHLDSDLVLVKFSGQAANSLDDSRSDKLLSILTLETHARPGEISGFLEWLPSSEDREAWSRLLRETELADDVRQRIRDREKFLHETRVKMDRLLSAEAVMENYSYPLTLFGMIVVVLAVGYLLAFNPSLAQFLPEQVRDAQLSKSVRYSVILIVVMSGLDLAWTMLSSSVGLMNELNPVGSDLINDPAALMKFKTAATLLAAGLFLALRNFRSAQLASWWMCIVCTLVSARWLVFNSLYMG